MADTKSHHAPIAPVEGDGISYSGIVWFVVILVVTTVVCQVLMVVLFDAMAYQKTQTDRTMQASPLASVVTDRPAPGGQGDLQDLRDGRVYPGMAAIGRPNGPEPALLVREPLNLEALRAREHAALTTYGWADRNAGTFRIPIDRAKDLIMEQGFPVRGTDAPKDVKQVKEVKK